MSKMPWELTEEVIGAFYDFLDKNKVELHYCWEYDAFLYSWGLRDGDIRYGRPAKELAFDAAERLREANRRDLLKDYWRQSQWVNR